MKQVSLKSLCSLCFPPQVFQWQLLPQQPSVFGVGRCAVVQTWQGQTWNPGLRPSLRVRKSPIALSYCLFTVSHYYPSTTNNLIQKALKKIPALSRLAGWIWASFFTKSCTPSITPPLLYYTPLSQLSSTGTHSMGSDQIWFHRDRLRSATSVVALLPHSTTEPVHPQRTSDRAMEDGAMGKERERAQKISNARLWNRPSIGHSRISLISRPQSPDLSTSSALPPDGRIPAGFEPPV